MIEFKCFESNLKPVPSFLYCGYAHGDDSSVGGCLAFPLDLSTSSARENIKTPKRSNYFTLTETGIVKLIR